MGCIRALFVQVGCLVLLVAAAVLGFLYRDKVMEVYRDLRGHRPAAAVAYSAPSPDAGRAAEQTLTRLGRRGGPAYVDLTAAELASLLDRELARTSGGGFDSVRVALDSGSIVVRGMLDLSRVPHDFLGPFGGSLSGREQLEAGGELLAAPGGGLRWRPTSLRIKDFPIPRRAIPALLRALHARPDAEGAVALPGVTGVGDVRVTPQAVRLYRLERQ